MTIHRLNAIAAAALAALAWSTAGTARAEVSVVQGRLRVDFSEGRTWAPARADATGEELLNPFGDARGDGPPALGVNPVTGAAEAAWGLGGSMPGLVYARFDEQEGRWNTVRVPAARSGSRWAGRTPELTHDAQGNTYLLYEDAESGQVLLASVARGSLRVNPPIVLATPQRPGTSPRMHWDGRELVVAFVRADSPDKLEVHGLQPEWDAAGRIPDGGEGIPGIPEPIFGYAGVPGGITSDRPLGDSTGPGLGGTTAVALDEVPPMLRLEPLVGGRLLVSWVVGDRLLWSQRAVDDWSSVAWMPLENPLELERMRDLLVQQLGGRVQAAPGRSWALGRRLPDSIDLHERRR